MGAVKGNQPNLNGYETSAQLRSVQLPIISKPKVEVQCRFVLHIQPPPQHELTLASGSQGKSDEMLPL